MRTQTRIGFLFMLIGTLAFAGCEREGAIVVPPAPAVDQNMTLNSKDFGDYVLHFNAIRTDSLTPEVARAYGIVRSNSRAMLNVTIIRKQNGEPGKPVPGSVTVYASNLTGQVKNMTMRQVIEGDAVYYIGELPVANAETLIFEISATPINETSRFAARFQRQFYTD